MQRKDLEQKIPLHLLPFTSASYLLDLNVLSELPDCKTLAHRIATSSLGVPLPVQAMVQETAQGVSILQPGSSVATALSEGESKRKHVVVLEVLDQSFRVVKQELQTVRPFKFDQVISQVV